MATSVDGFSADALIPRSLVHARKQCDDDANGTDDTAVCDDDWTTAKVAIEIKTLSGKKQIDALREVIRQIDEDETNLRTIMCQFGDKIFHMVVSNIGYRVQVRY